MNRFFKEVKHIDNIDLNYTMKLTNVYLKIIISNKDDKIGIKLFCAIELSQYLILKIYGDCGKVLYQKSIR